MMNFQSIPVSLIDKNDQLYVINYQHQLDYPLDVEDMNYFQPIWIQEKEDQTFRIIDGFYRLAQWRATQSDKPVPAVVSPKRTNNFKIWKQRILLSHAEKKLTASGFWESLLRILNSLSFKAIDLRQHEDLSLLKIGKEKLTMEDAQNVCDKSKIYQNFTDILQLSFSDIASICWWSYNDLKSISILLADLHLKGNKLTSILDSIKQTVKGQNMTIDNIINMPSVIDCLKTESSNQRYSKLKSVLVELSFPTLTALRSKWNSTLKRLALPRGLTIETDPYFESDELVFRIISSSVDELDNTLEYISSRAHSDELKTLFSMI